MRDIVANGNTSRIMHFMPKATFAPLLRTNTVQGVPLDTSGSPLASAVPDQTCPEPWIASAWSDEA